MQNTKSVLIVDDDIQIARTFSRILKKKGFETEIALSGKEAIVKANQRAFTVALVDICLTDMTGTELLSKMHESHGEIIKIIITGFPTTIPSKSVKADAYLLKPVQPTELLAVIEAKTKEQ